MSNVVEQTRILERVLVERARVACQDQPNAVGLEQVVVQLTAKELADVCGCLRALILIGGRL